MNDWMNGLIRFCHMTAVMWIDILQMVSFLLLFSSRFRLEKLENHQLFLGKIRGKWLDNNPKMEFLPLTSGKPV